MDVHARDLRYFAMVAEELHFTRSAERLFISQPALSKQIRGLERALGAPLFTRDRREVRLTSVGKALLPHARRLVAAWEEAQAAVEEAKAVQQSTLVVGMSTSPGRGGMLPAIRSRFAADFPGVELALRQFGWSDTTAGLADGSSDVAFVWLPLPDEDRYRWIVLVEEQRHVALPETHPLAAQESVVFSDLLDEPFLALPEGSGRLRDHFLATDAREGRPPLIGGQVSSPDETYEALVAGQGICLLASGNAPLLTRSGVVTRPVRDLSPSQLALAWRAEDNRRLLQGYVRAARLAQGQERAVTGNS